MSIGHKSSIVVLLCLLCLRVTPAVAHNYGSNGVCTDAGCTEPYQPAPLVEGFYELSNAGQVEWFSAEVNKGGNNMFLNARLMADIDFQGVTHTPIGSTEGHKFNGHFDGQAHRILNLTLSSTDNLQGFFGGLRGGGTVVENLILDRSCSISGRQRVGGIAAFAQTVQGTPIVIRGCINEATITGTSTAVGGILGGSMSPHPCIHIIDCHNAGTIKGSGESAAIAGWLGDNAASCVRSCYNTGRLTGMDASHRNMVRCGAGLAVENCHDMNPPSGALQGIATAWTTDDPLSSGELCYVLNGPQQDGGWRQTLGDDPQPLPFPTHARVFANGEVACDGSLIAGSIRFSNTEGATTVTGHHFTDGICIHCGTVQPGYYTTPRKVFIMAGQSNADGRPAISTMPQYIQELVAQGGSRYCHWSYCNGSQWAWDTFGGKLQPYMPYTDNNATTRCGFDGIIYHMIEEALSERFYVIKESRGGTAIDTRASSSGNLWWCCDPTWLSNASPRSGHSLALELMENIGLCIDNTLSQLEEGYEIACIMWHQGESDRSYASSYKANLKQVVATLRQYLVEKTGNPRYATLPFIAGTFNTSSTQYNAVVAASIRRLSMEDPDFHMVDLTDCSLGSDNLHFDAAGCEKAAGKYFRLIESLGLLSKEDPTAIHRPSTSLPTDDPTTAHPFGDGGTPIVYDLMGRPVATGSVTAHTRSGIHICQGKKHLAR